MDWLPVATRVWNDAWVLSLKPHAKLLWLYLITANDYGFIEVCPELWQFQTGIKASEIEQILQLFIAAGKAQRSSNMLCLPRALYHRRLRGNNLIGAINDLRERYADKYPELVQAVIAGSAAQIEPRTNRVPTPYQPGTHGVDTSERSERSETKHHTSAAASAAPEGPPVGEVLKQAAHPRPTAQKKPHESAEPAYSPEQLALAERMERDLAELVKRGFTPGRNWRRRPEQVALSLRACEIPCERLEAAWIWGLEDAFWSSQILNQGSFVQQPNRWNALVNKWLAQANAKSQHGRNEHDMPDAEIAR